MTNDVKRRETIVGQNGKGSSWWYQREIVPDRVKWTRKTLFWTTAIHYIPSGGELELNFVETNAGVS